MRFMKLGLISAVSSLAAVAVLVSPADAACQRLGFTVNDYGKDGPTRDAKNLLDKYIARWTSERGIKNYKTGQKAVKCELFLDVGLFDEYTCTAEATFCWDGPAVPSAKPQTAATTGEEAPKPEKPKDAKAPDSGAGSEEAKPAKKAAAKEKDAAKDAPVETGSTAKAEEPPEVEAKPEPRDLGDPDPASENYGGKNPASGQ